MNKYIYIILAIIPLKLIAVEGVIYEKKIHTDSVDSLCLSANAIISGSFDGSIKSTKANESTIIGMHKDWVRKIICSGSNIISASNDGMITIWNDMKKIHSVQAHTWWVTDIALSSNQLISVSLDETIKFWSYPQLELIYSYKIFGSNKHMSLIINDGKAFIGSTKGFMFIIYLDSKLEKRYRVAGDASVLTSSAKSPKYVYFGTSDGYIIKISTDDPNKSYRKKMSEYAIKAIVENQEILYLGDDNGVIRRVNTKKFDESYVLSRHSEAVRSIAVDENNIYAGYDGGYIRVFEIKVSPVNINN